MSVTRHHEAGFWTKLASEEQVPQEFYWPYIGSISRIWTRYGRNLSPQVPQCISRGSKCEFKQENQEQLRRVTSLAGVGGIVSSTTRVSHDTICKKTQL